MKAGLPLVLEGNESSRIILVDAGANSVSGECRELYRFSGSFGGGSTRQCLAKRIVDDGGQRLAGVVGQALGRFEQLVACMRRSLSVIYQ